MNITEAFAIAVHHHQAGNLAMAQAVYRQILAADPDDVGALSNLGIIVPPDEAMELFKRALTVKPDHVEALINLAHAVKAKGEVDEALALYERAIAINPAFPRLIFDLANALKQQGRLDEAVAQYHRALAVTPNFIDAYIQLGDALQRQNKAEDAIAVYERALAIDADHALVHFGLGFALHALQRNDAAAAHYERAVALKPDFVSALHQLGALHDDPNKPNAAAEKWLRWTLTVDPTVADANVRLVRLLEAEGRLNEAKMFGNRLQRPLAMLTDRAGEQPPHRTVLLPSVLGPGNVPVHSLLPGRTTTFIRWFVDYTTDEQEAELPPHDVLFNGVGNADLSAPSHSRLMRLYDQGKMLNSPIAVARTRRDLLPELLADIPNVIVPRVVRLRRDEVLNVNMAAKLSALGLSCPLLMRPIVGHSGEGMVLVETPRELVELKYSNADAYYFIAYHDYHSTDDHFRKYRMIFVDRKPYPYHLAISEKWLVHYFSANMNAGAWKKEEEERFRADPTAALGAKATAAVEAIAQRLDLDFGGIDFSVTPDGDVLVFEANATMSVFNPETDEDGKFKHAATIVAAFDAMIEKFIAARK